MTATTIVIVCAIVLQAVKLVDMGFGMWRVYRATDQEAPIYEWVRRRGSVAKAIANSLYRGPAIVLVTSALVLTLRGVPSTTMTVSAILSTVMAAGLIAFYLTGVVSKRPRRGDLHRQCGFHANRTNVERTDGDALHPILIILMVTCSVIAAYAALYHAIFIDDPHAFHAPEPLGLIRAAYLSVITLTTVGFGDYYPVSKPAEMAAASEVLLAVTVLSLFITALSGRNAEHEQVLAQDE